MTATRPGRFKTAAKINQENRQILNKYSSTLTEKALAKALTGDGPALLACTQLLLAANQEPKT
jgi:hypothetical protein